MESDNSAAARSAAVEIRSCSVAVRCGTLARSVVHAASPKLAITLSNIAFRECSGIFDSLFSPCRA
jgi:hypothetical protein